MLRCLVYTSAVNVECLVYTGTVNVEVFSIYKDSEC